MTESEPQAVFRSIHRTCLSPLVTDRAMEAWYPSLTHLAREGAYDSHLRTAEVARRARRRGGRVAARGARAAAGDAHGRVRHRSLIRLCHGPQTGVSPGLARSGLCRRTK